MRSRPALRAIRLWVLIAGVGSPVSAQGENPPVDERAIARAVERYLDAHPPAAPGGAPDDALARLQLFGDLRLRHESTVAAPNARDRHRSRVRLRLGAGYLIGDELTLGARVVTGDRADPKSPHVTLGDGFDGLEISLDRAFVTYRPSWAQNATATAGKFDHPLARNPVYGELVWDADVQPEGLAASYRQPAGEVLAAVTATAGAFPLLERSDGADSTVAVGELAAELRPGKRVSARISAGYTYYDNVDPRGTTSLFDTNRGNATTDTDRDDVADAFVSDFGILDVQASFTVEGPGAPWSIAAEYVENTRADIARDRGWALGASYGGARDAGDLRAYYQWQVIEQDAVFSPVSQDDFPFATNFRGHVFGAGYQITDAAGLHLWSLVAAPDSGTTSDDDVWRFRVDFNVKF